MENGEKNNGSIVSIMILEEDDLPVTEDIDAMKFNTAVSALMILLNTMEKYKLNTDEGEYLFENHLKIDNTNLSPDEVVEIIMEKFELNR